MNCYYHPTKSAVVQCKQCGKGFCEECASTVIDGLCPSCRQDKEHALDQLETQKVKEGQKWHRLGVYAVLPFIVLLVIMILFDFEVSDNIRVIFSLSTLGIILFVLRYSRRIIFGLVGKFAHRGVSYALDSKPLFFGECILTYLLIVPLSPFLFIYSLLRAFWLKKGISDYVTFLKR